MNSFTNDKCGIEALVVPYPQVAPNGGDALFSWAPQEVRPGIDTILGLVNSIWLFDALLLYIVLW